MNAQIECLGLTTRRGIFQLCALGVSLGRILEELRHDPALRYLRDPNLSLSQIAFLRGYPNTVPSAMPSGDGPGPRRVSGGRSTPHSDSPPSREHPKLDPYTLDEHNGEVKPFTWTADLEKLSPPSSATTKRWIRSTSAGSHWADTTTISPVICGCTEQW